MKMLNLEVDKSKKYVLACSFGPDSMALFDLCLKNNINFVVAHVNYHKRDISNYEQEALTKFCDEHNIKIEVLDTENLVSKGNFQEWARETRYNFFKKVADKNGCDAVLVAHQEDDLIETYLMQKKRGNTVKYWGIARENEIFGVKIIRPLLAYTKKELMEYDLALKIPFSIDESNLSDHYTRNKIRHHIVETMSKEERKEIVDQIKNLPCDEVVIKTEYKTEEFINTSTQNIVLIFDYYMQKTCEHRDLSARFLNEIKKAMKTKANFSVKITNSILLESNYGQVSIVNLRKLAEYSYKFSDKFENELIKIDFSKGAEDRKIFSTSNLIVRNIKPSDELTISNYTVKARRLFIDWKMPAFLRKVWPVICDDKNNIIYVPRYRKDFKDEHSSKFEINISYLREF